jgi:hypothetical protein
MSDPTEDSHTRKPDAEVIAALARATVKVTEDINEQVEVARRPPPSQAWKSVVGGVLSAGALVAWLAFPPHVDETDPRSASRVERDLKLDIASLAEQVEDFRKAHGGALPDALSEAGASSEVVQYQRLSPLTYELRGAERDVSVTYQSTQGLEAFAAGLVIQGVRP